MANAQSHTRPRKGKAKSEIDKRIKVTLKTKKDISRKVVDGDNDDDDDDDDVDSLDDKGNQQ